MMNRRIIFLMPVIFIGCSTDQVEEETLEFQIKDNEVVLDNVIACAASNEDPNTVSVFFYPRNGATNPQYFETASTDVDKNDFSNYERNSPPLLDIFNGYLKKYEVSSAIEKWVIVTFEEEGKTHISNPIRLKQATKPTENLPENLTIDASTTMPDFNWQDGTYDDTKIYFQVLSDARQNLISGTYTFERAFKFYELDNVVLNITAGTPVPLMRNTIYKFTLMAVSEDNWVNQFSEIDFEIE